MAQTIPDLTITTTWQSLNTLTGISIGTAMSIDNKSTGVVLLAEGTEPTANSRDGVPLTNYKDNIPNRAVLAGSLEVWARMDSNSGTGTISVQTT